MRILVGIVTFNPDLGRLEENLSAVLAEPIDYVLVFDNGSENISEICTLTEYYQTGIYKNNCNTGIASALRYIMNFAISNDYDWVMTLDQDSVIRSGLVKEYKSYESKLRDAAMLTCIIQDRNFTESNSYDNKTHEITRCISSAAFINVKCYEQTAGYDEKMFIDYVDFDMCYSLIEAGFKIYRIPFLGLLHEVGNGRNVSFFGKQYIVYNHSACRKYYLIRNSIYCAKKHPPFDSLLIAFREMLFVLIYEKDKKKKIVCMLKGFIDGLGMKEERN